VIATKPSPASEVGGAIQRCKIPRTGSKIRIQVKHQLYIYNR
jgi:hypothetical protein